MLFPLPLTPFEYYYWYDDRAEYPTTYPFELVFSGSLQQDRFRQALRIALDRHPLLQCIIDPGVGRIPSWIPALEQTPPIETPPVDWSCAETPITHPDGERIDLTKSTGLRVWVRHSAETTRLFVQFHHACCDGLGALRFLKDVMIAYNCLVLERDATADLSPLNAERLKLRGDYGLTEANYRANLRDSWITCRQWGEILLRQPALVLPRGAVPAGTTAPSPYLAFVTGRIESERLRQLRKEATSHNATLNDRLLRDLFVTVRDWNAQANQSQNSWRQNSWLRINMPADLRLRADRAMPAANVLGFSFLTRHVRECERPQQLLESIREETAAIRRWRLSLYFVGGLRFATGIPGMMRWLLRRERTFATIVMSNLGRVFARAPLERQNGKVVCGDVVLQRVSAVPPIRPRTRAAMVALSYADEMTVSLRCDPKFFSVEETQALLDTYLERLHTSP